MRLLHIADPHLDSPMRGLARRPGAPVDVLRGASRAAFSDAVSLALDEALDAVLIAGDLYDGDWQDYSTGLFFLAQVNRLREAGIPVVMISGNHDAHSRITRRLRLPDGVRLLDHAAPETAVLDELGLAVHGQSYARPDVTDDLAARYPPPLAGMVNVGLLHTCGDGASDGHAPYAPCRLPALRAHGYDYWALGHIHDRRVLCEDPPVVFAGNLQGRSVRECGAKGATIVTLGEGPPRWEHRTLDHVRWAVATPALGDAHSLEDVVQGARDAVAASLDGADGRLLAVRVALEGATEAHGELARAGDRLRAEIEAALLDLPGEVWLEKVTLRTEAPGDPALGDEAIDAVLAGLDATVADETAIAGLAGRLATLASRLPPELRAEWDPSDPATVRELLGDVARTLPAILRGAA